MTGRNETFLGFATSGHRELYPRMVNLSDIDRVIAAGLTINDPGRDVPDCRRLDGDR